MLAFAMDTTMVFVALEFPSVGYFSKTCHYLHYFYVKYEIQDKAQALCKSSIESSHASSSSTPSIVSTYFPNITLS